MTTDAFGLVGRTLGEKYTVEELVATGGFGVVYRARHTELDTRVAVKVLHIAREADALSRTRFLEGFRAEARVVARLDHPAIARVLDFGVSPMPDGDPAPWMVLEWVEGRTLKADLKERRGGGGRSPRECLALLRPIFEALAQAHEDGIAHRDIKPANMILAAPRSSAPALEGRTRRAQGLPMRLLDFGIAKIMQADESVGSGETATAAEARQYTMAYAAPEQVGGKRTGPWTDVHALALVLTEMLTDTAPYRGDDKVEVLRQVVALERPTPRRAGLDVGPWEPVLARALAVVPAERYADAGEFLAALEADVPEAVRRIEAPAVDSSVTAPTAVTAITSTTAPSVSDALSPAMALPKPAPPATRRGPRYAASGALCAALLGAGALIAVRGKSPPSQPHDAQPTAHASASTGGRTSHVEVRALAVTSPPPEPSAGSPTDAGVQVAAAVNLAQGVVRVDRSPTVRARGGNELVRRSRRDGGVGVAPTASAVATPPVVERVAPSPAPRPPSETLPPP